mmetsp:Transcript_12702/g.27572  ORF Transcript_12702/g.27572 Transcript_12702/m.27572 type:complete len:91 (+) Transcript_12702:34-306(+)
MMGLHRADLLSTTITLASLLIACGMCRAFMVYWSTLVGSSAQHEHLLRNVLNSPYEFFLKNPSGKIMSNFSFDQLKMDDLLPLNVEENLK